MCADGAKAPAERFAYSNALQGFYRVWRDEGIATFGRGISANVTRSILMSERILPPFHDCWSGKTHTLTQPQTSARLRRKSLLSQFGSNS